MIRYLPAATVILCATLALIGTALGAHIARWEVITWQVLTIAMASCAIGWQWSARGWEKIAADWRGISDEWRDLCRKVRDGS